MRWRAKSSTPARTPDHSAKKCRLCSQGKYIVIPVSNQLIAFVGGQWLICIYGYIYLSPLFILGSNYNINLMLVGKRLRMNSGLYREEIQLVKARLELGSSDLHVQRSNCLTAIPLDQLSFKNKPRRK